MEKQNGLTVVEFIVIVIIIATLAEIVSIGVNEYKNEEKNSTIEADMATLAINAITYFDSESKSFWVLFYNR